MLGQEKQIVRSKLNCAVTYPNPKLYLELFRIGITVRKVGNKHWDLDGIFVCATHRIIERREKSM